MGITAWVKSMVQACLCRKYLYPVGKFPRALSMFQFNSESYFSEGQLMQLDLRPLGFAVW